MNKEEIIKKIIQREKLKQKGRLARLLSEPRRTLPFYFLAFFSHIRPYKISFHTLWGTRMTSYLPEGNTFYYYGYCEANLTNFIIRNCKPGNTVIDIGAHVGFYTILCSALVGNTGQIHSFEPTPRTYGILKENTSKLKNVSIHNVAIADTQSYISFFDYGAGYGAYNTANPQGAASLEKEMLQTIVPSITLDEYCIEHSIQPDIIKLDAEGFEYKILLGMKEITTKDTHKKRPLISLEVAGDDHWKENRDSSITYLTQQGFTPYEIKTDGSICRHTIASNYSYDNLIFIPEERIKDYDNH